jgi:hypothetical protein
MRYVVPPIVIPILLFIGVAAYGLLRPPIVARRRRPLPRFLIELPAPLARRWTQWPRF